MTARESWRRAYLSPDQRLVQQCREAIRLQGQLALDIQAHGQLDLGRTIRDKAMLGALACLEASGEVTLGTAVSPDGIVKATWHRPSERPSIQTANKSRDQADMLRPRTPCKEPQKLVDSAPTESGGARTE